MVYEKNPSHLSRFLLLPITGKSVVFFLPQLRGKFSTFCLSLFRLIFFFLIFTRNKYIFVARKYIFIYPKDEPFHIQKLVCQLPVKLAAVLLLFFLSFPKYHLVFTDTI